MRCSRLVFGALTMAALVTAGATVPAAAQELWTLPATVVVDPPTATDFQAGYSSAEDMTVTIEVNGNKKWRLYLSATAPDMGGYGKPVSDVFWRTSSSDWFPLSTSPVEVAVGHGSSSVALQFRARLEWATDGPGYYAAPIELSLKKK